MFADGFEYLANNNINNINKNNDIENDDDTKNYFM